MGVQLRERRADHYRDPAPGYGRERPRAGAARSRVSVHPLDGRGVRSAGCLHPHPAWGPRCYARAGGAHGG